MPNRVVIADDHPTVRVGLRAALASERFISIVGEASSPDELFMLLGSVPCDVLVTDLEMPGERRDGLAMVNQLKASFPLLPIVVFTVSRDVVLLRSLLAAGVSGLVNKTSEMSEVSSGIASALSGEIYLGSSLQDLDLFPRSRQSSVDEASVSLSDAERYLLDRLSSEASEAEIGAELGCSVAAVSHRRIVLQRKLGVGSRLELKAYWARANFAQ